MASAATLPCPEPFAPGPIPAAPFAPAPFLPAAFAHGAFLVGPDGTVQPRGGASLRFAWRGRRCEVRLEPGRLRLSAVLGAVPYTAERADDRPAALAAIGRLPSELPPGWRLRLLPDHRVRVEVERGLPSPVAAIALIGEMVGFALDLDRYLDRLESAGLATGRAKT